MAHGPWNLRRQKGVRLAALAPSLFFVLPGIDKQAWGRQAHGQMQLARIRSPALELGRLYGQ